MWSCLAPAAAAAGFQEDIHCIEQDTTPASANSHALPSLLEAEASYGLHRVRSKSSNFHFQFKFGRNNPGRLDSVYDLEPGRLGEGSFGSTRVARCKQTGLSRAVKSIRLTAKTDPVRLEREIEIGKQVDHPNMVRLFETFQEKDRVHLVMELCSGGELFDRIADAGASGFSEATAAEYVQQMLAGICYLHAHEIAHRDVKPENILFESHAADAALKLIDFGLATRFKPGALMTTRVGTAYYVAPEVLRSGDARGYSEKCDVWSAGVIAYVLLCGYTPFSGDTDMEILKKVRKGLLSFHGTEWTAVSQAAKHAVGKLLAFKSPERPSAQQALELPWLRSPLSGPQRPRPDASDIVARLQEFQQHSRMKRVALTAVAQQLPTSDADRFWQLFRDMDRDGDGELSAEEVRQGLAGQGLQVPRALDGLLRTVDCNGSGGIDYTEFVAAMMDQEQYGKYDLCLAAFRSLDLDGDGMITSTELTKLLSGSHDGSPQISAARIGRMISEVDTNGDGNVDFEEFCAMMSPGTPPALLSRRTSTQSTRELPQPAPAPPRRTSRTPRAKGPAAHAAAPPCASRGEEWNGGRSGSVLEGGDLVFDASLPEVATAAHAADSVARAFPHCVTRSRRLGSHAVWRWASSRSASSHAPAAPRLLGRWWPARSS